VKKNKISMLISLFVGLLFFILSQTYSISLLMACFWLVLVLVFKILGAKVKLANLKNLFFTRRNALNVVAFILPLLLSLPYFYAIYANSVSTSPTGQLSSAINFSAQTVKANITFNWLFDIPALSFFFSSFGQLLALTPIALILSLLLLVPPISRRIPSIISSKRFPARTLLIYIFLLLILAYLTVSLYLPINVLSYFFDPARVLQHIFVPSAMLTAIVIFWIVDFSTFSFKRYVVGFQKTLSKTQKLARNRILAFILLVLFVPALILSGVPIVNEGHSLYGSIGKTLSRFESLGHDDVLLMNWIKENVPSDSKIIVSAGDSGQFVTAVAQRKTVSIYSYSQDYRDLMGLLTSNATDLRAMGLLIQFNVSYVYVGSIDKGTYDFYAAYRHFNVSQLESSPYFTLTKEIGNAWLFQFNASAALAAYDAAAPLPEYVDQWHPSTYINILASEGGYTDPLAGIYYGSGALAVSAFANESYKLDHWMLNGSYLCGPENPVNVDYLNWNIQPVFTKNT
jgi:hypothetical protein